MKNLSHLMLAAVFALAGTHASLAKKKKSPPEPDVKLKAELDRKTLPADKAERVVLKITLEPARLLPKEAARPPVNLALVLDRSGSMTGQKLEKAKEAAVQAVHRLGARDVVSIVTYDSAARVLVPARSAKDVEGLVQAVRSLRAGGNTALFAGVNLGASEVRKHLEGQYFNRLILLSDGLANMGPSKPEDLIRLGRALVKEDISVSTVGLGKGYNEDLMTGIAREGQGNLYFAETSGELPGILDAEIGDALNVVADKARIRIELETGIRPLRLIGRQGVIRGNEVEVEIKQLYGGQEKFALLEVEVPAGKAKEKKNLAHVVVEMEAAGDGAAFSRKVSVGCSFSEKREEVTASTNKRVAEAYVDNQLADAKDRAIALADQGRHAEAVSELKKLNVTIDTQNQVWNLSGVSSRQKKFLSEVECLERDKGLTNRNRKTWRTDNYQIQTQQKIVRADEK